MGVDLSLKTPSGEITGHHLAPQNHSFSYGNPYVLVSLMGVDLSLKTPSGEITGPQLGTSESIAFLRKFIHSGSPNGGGSQPQTPLRARLLQPI